MKRPALKKGQFSGPRDIWYNCDEAPELSGPYTVELGYEFKQADHKTYRQVRVNGHVMEAMYAMKHGSSGPHYRSVTIERDEQALLTRAASMYIPNVLIPALEVVRGKEQQKRYRAALNSADTWKIQTSAEGRISIHPIDIGFLDEDYPTLPDVYKRKQAILRRLLKLAKLHGLKGFKF